MSKKIKKNQAVKGNTTMKEKQDDAIAQLKAHDKKPIDIVKDAAIPPAAAAAAIIVAEQSKTAEPAKLTLPAMTAEFCLQDLKFWEGKDDVYNPNASDCITCQEDFPEQPAICAARSAYLVSLTGKKSKVKGSAKTPRAKSVKVNGAPNQTDIINGLLKAATPLADIITAVATSHYGGSADTAKGRVTRHIKSINDRSCKSAVEMKPYMEYLSPKAAAPAAPAA